MFQIIWFILALADGRARKERRHERACFERDEEAGDVNSRTTTGNNGQIRVQQYMYTYEYVYSNARVVHNVLKNTHMSKEIALIVTYTVLSKVHGYTHFHGAEDRYFRTSIIINVVPTKLFYTTLAKLYVYVYNYVAHFRYFRKYVYGSTKSHTQYTGHALPWCRSMILPYK
eukprot:31384-Pelagococcus_subviridis.AAC.13